ncbi:hypothetical protein RHSIM_Rhsim04G0102700 [Rhododendron simsii]|uniref:Uncharacterized protein n=1 Tax=Rhododendron simsii TaxID=118357 RepID=A0A834H0K5_RHOSS|nr:hypothetical protein RHSIM_Rhsim04G0102700 [Rhododendron simsii]
MERWTAEIRTPHPFEFENISNVLISEPKSGIGLLMEDPTTKGRHELNLASRKAEDAAWRRFQALRWLDSLVGSLGISTQPTEREFISCLRNGMVLCNVINKIQPGSVPKVVEIHSPSEVPTWDSQPLPAYQYFENVRNFLVAVEELKLPAFEASDLERDNLEVGSSVKVVDCILGLKAYHEWKQTSGGHGFFKPPRSPMVMHSASRVHSQASGTISKDPCRKLDMSTACNSFPPPESGTRNLEDSIAKAIAECMVDSKENIDDNLLISLRYGSKDPIKLFGSILSNCLGQQVQNKLPEVLPAFGDSNLVFGTRIHAELLRSKWLKPIFNDLLGGVSPLAHSTSTPLGNLDNKHCRACLKKGSCNHRNLFRMQEKELSNLKKLLSKTKSEFEYLQSQLQRDLKQLGSQVEEMSSAALGYHKVVKENRKLYNMVQDLKGNIRVYCRIRPAFSAEARNVVDFIGEDGSLAVLDPLKPQKDGRKVFQFNRVFGPTATQEEIFKDTEAVIRSVMDGYNVCIFAYGQTGSGKTHTMVSCDSENGPSVPDATIHSVKSTSDVLSLMKLGEVNRIVSSTAINNQSSRSHSILTVLVHGKDVSGSTLRSCLHLVDLAGSERVAKSEVTGDGLKEAQYINKSLSCLGDVIAALAQKSSYIPYRNSKLTLLLQNSLGGHAKTLMFAHVSPEADSFGETISTLKFAQRASTVELGAARMNKESTEVKALKEQIESLKKALANKEALSGQPKEPRSPLEKQAMNERTPPRSRRLSIENCRTMEKEKPRSTPERTPPPRSRKLSIENCNTEKKEKSTMNAEEKRGTKTPSMPTRSRRLSLEGPKLPEAGSKPCEQRAPRSPTSAVYTSKVSKTDGRAKIRPIELPKTPEPPSKVARNEVQIMTSSTNGKGSQIRKSLRTIGKLINGSDKRNQQKLVEASAETGVHHIQDARSPVSANARALRRQSLTGGIQVSRRSSLGGKSTDSCK